MRTETRHGCFIRVWSMSVMGWRWNVVLPDGSTKAGTKRSESAALTAAREATRAWLDASGTAAQRD